MQIFRDVLKAAVLAGALFGTCFAQITKPLSGARQQWEFRLGEPAFGPVVPIGDEQSVDVLAVATASGKIVLLSPTGEKLRELKLDLTPGTPPLPGEARGAEGRDIIATDAFGAVYCFGQNGTLRWKYAREDRTANSFTFLTKADLDGDGHDEFLVSTQRGNLFAVDHRGRLRLDIQASKFRISSAAVGDVNGDGIQEIVFADDDGGIHCLNAHGDLLWNAHIPDGRFGRTMPLIADADGDGRYEVYVLMNSGSLGSGLFVFDAANGKMLWKANTPMQTYASLAFTPVNGSLHVLFGDKSTTVYDYDAAGRKQWSKQVPGLGIMHAPAVVDLAGDGHPIVLQAVRGGSMDGRSIYAFDTAGQEIDSLRLKNGEGGLASPALFRFRGKDALDMVTVSQAGTVTCYELPQQHSARAKILWPGTRDAQSASGFVRSSHPIRSGSAAPPQAARAAAAIEQRWAVSGPNRITLNRLAGAQAGLIRLRGPDGAIKIKMLGAEDAPNFEFDAHVVGTYIVSAYWNGSRAAAQTIRYVLDGAYTGDARALAEFQKQVAAIGSHSDLATYYSAAAQAFGESERTQWPTWLQLLRRSASLPATAKLLVQQIDNPWPDFDPVATFSETGISPNQIHVRMLGNEYESCAVAVANLSARPVTIRFQRKAFVLDGKSPVLPEQVLELRSVPSIRAGSDGLAKEDVLPLLGQGQTMRLGPGETQKLWLTFNSKHLEPGVYKSELITGDLLSLEQPLTVPIQVEVRPLRIPDKHVYQHNNWLILDPSQSDTVFEATIQDALDHGTNVFDVPPVTVDVSADGKLGNVEKTFHDRIIHRLQGRARFLVMGTVNLHWPKDFKPPQELSERVQADAIRWYASYMESLGLGRKDWAFYVHDEPGLTGNDETFRKWVRDVHFVKAADPTVQIYADPAGGARFDMLQPVADLIDIWQPDLSLLRGDPEHLGPLFKQKTYWHYEPPGEQRELNPLGYYRMKPWIAYQLGMTGGGYWVYSWTDYWFFDRTMGSEFGTVYPTNEGPVTTKRWEASRDGIEDFELLWMLRAAAQQARGEQSQKALALIDEAVRFVTAGQEHVSDIQRKLHPYTPDYGRWMKYRDRIIAAYEAISAR